MSLAQHVFDNVDSILPAQLGKESKEMTMQTS
jgi:hypothetical protein